MVTPYFTQHSPPALVAMLPPIEQISNDEGSGGYPSPCSAAAAFTSALNAPARPRQPGVVVEHADLLTVRTGPDLPAEGHRQELVAQADAEQRRAVADGTAAQRLHVREPRVVGVVVGAHLTTEHQQPDVAGQVRRQGVTRIRPAYVDRETGLHEPLPHPSGRALRLVLDDQQGKGAHPANLSPATRGGSGTAHTISSSPAQATSDAEPEPAA